jgi:hypothetical protein
MRNNGVTLIETVLSAALLLLVAMFGLECFGVARRLFVGLKSSQEEGLAAAAALESLRRDAARAGEGLALPIGLGLVAGAELRTDGFVIRWAGDSNRIAADIVPGQTKILLESGDGLAPGRSLCLSNGDLAEIHQVRTTGDGWVVIDEGADHSFGREEGFCFAVEAVANWLDRASRTVRRRVNDGAGQPLLEETALFETDWDPEGPLFRFRLRPDSAKERTYEESIVPKNLALISRSSE